MILYECKNYKLFEFKYKILIEKCKKKIDIYSKIVLKWKKAVFIFSVFSHT
jgi:hypothetical protein